MLDRSSTSGPGGYEGLSLNFATMRSTLSGDKGDGTVQRAERWFLKRLSNFAQIESLWRFNAKYEPEWLPRYVVFDTAEHLVPVVMAILRAESVWEIPVLGKLLAAGAEKRMLAAQRETEEFIASSFGPLDGEDELTTDDDGAGSSLRSPGGCTAAGRFRNTRLAVRVLGRYASGVTGPPGAAPPGPGRSV